MIIATMILFLSAHTNTSMFVLRVRLIRRKHDYARAAI